MTGPDGRAGRHVFVDTSAYFALTDATEARNPSAEAIRRRLVVERRPLVTTNFVVAETHALLLTRIGYRFALRFLDDIHRSPTSLVRVTEADETDAHTLVRRYDDKRFSFTDATSFAVMGRLGLTEAFTFDQNFAQYGFVVLQPV